MTTPAEIVTAFFTHFRAGEIALALSFWAPGARWTVLGQSTRARDYSMPDYIALCGEWRAEYPDYVADYGAVSALGDLAYFPIRSRNGEAPGEAEGLMMYRVVDGVIVEGWALPASHGGAYAF